jgi:N4-(beta-N-acetylglucosaminyl)-L-asparaginase
LSDAFSRRDFLGTASAALAGGSLLTPAATAFPGAPALHLRGPTKLMAVGSSNAKRGIALATGLVSGGADTLDAIVEGVKITELDPSDNSVGYGGLPNEEGVVQLDASCMHGPSRRAGAVAALEGIKTPSEVARLVLKYTDHILLVGEGAKRFALSYGFKEEELLTQESRELWLRWRANRGAEDDWVDVPLSEPAMARVTGTCNLNLVSAQGDISSVTTTSGLAWKIPGRAGDSPIVGAGQYTDNEIGAAGSTGLGEANIMACGGFLTVEHMRQGKKAHRRRPRDPEAGDRAGAGALAASQRPAEVPAQLLRAQQAGRVGRGLDLSQQVRHLHRGSRGRGAGYGVSL